MMGLYRKKPVVVEAVKFINGPAQEIEGAEPAWYRASRTIDGEDVGSINYVNGALNIRTLEGVMTAQPGDWIIRGVRGELYPCKPDIFEQTYEVAHDHP